MGNCDWEEDSQFHDLCPQFPTGDCNSRPLMFMIATPAVIIVEDLIALDCRLLRLYVARL